MRKAFTKEPDNELDDDFPDGVKNYITSEGLARFREMLKRHIPGG